jgi:hypothetical protein
MGRCIHLESCLRVCTGISGSVRICVHHATKLQYALKTLEKKKIRDSENSIEEVRK